ncbi:helix-turn-helix domain-containing protein [Leucothrix pacifica]|uniref:HTH cro/C1-type domain-containing protein n=1 Tax=Leucothrix pacifica TaxID=1247513 RepID=A0A317CQQ1_9GAMM|nr:hypothetical protein DKW60_00510 [Leucothrix pacifica]
MRTAESSQQLVCDRIGISRVTLRKVENGDPTISIGHCLSVLGVLDAKLLSKRSFT